MIGQTLSHYEILEKIGSGGMGEVFRAEDRDLELGRYSGHQVLPQEMATDFLRLRRSSKGPALPPR